MLFEEGFVVPLPGLTKCNIQDARINAVNKKENGMFPDARPVQGHNGMHRGAGESGR